MQFAGKYLDIADTMESEFTSIKRRSKSDEEEEDMDEMMKTMTHHECYSEHDYYDRLDACW